MRKFCSSDEFTVSAMAKRCCVLLMIVSRAETLSKSVTIGNGMAELNVNKVQQPILVIARPSIVFSHIHYRVLIRSLLPHSVPNIVSRSSPSYYFKKNH